MMVLSYDGDSDGERASVTDRRLLRCVSDVRKVSIPHSQQTLQDDLFSYTVPASPRQACICVAGMGPNIISCQFFVVFVPSF